jgi:hypothetical protein
MPAGRRRVEKRQDGRYWRLENMDVSVGRAVIIPYCVAKTVRGARVRRVEKKRDGRYRRFENRDASVGRAVVVPYCVVKTVRGACRDWFPEMNVQNARVVPDDTNGAALVGCRARRSSTIQFPVELVSELEYHATRLRTPTLTTVVVAPAARVQRATGRGSEPLGRIRRRLRGRRVTSP